MKKIRNILIICVLIMFVVPLYSVAQTINLKSSNKNDMVKPGDKIDIIISKEGIEDTYQIDGVLSYDENILELQTQQDGKKYVVLDTILYKDKKYVYLVEYKNEMNIKFCIEVLENDQIKLTEVDDMNLKQRLLLLFTKNLKNELDNILKNE